MREEVLAEYLRPYGGPDGVAAFFRFVRSLDGRGLADREADLGRLEIPVLIFWGEDDPFFPPAIAERLNTAIPSSTLGLVPGSGHFLVDDAVETIGPMIHEYLRARYLRAPHGHGDPTGTVMIQLERRPPWLDLDDDDDDEDGEDA
jgi:pimeloyl-ACP methyl ester carboxylesterase